MSARIVIIRLCLFLGYMNQETIEAFNKEKDKKSAKKAPPSAGSKPKPHPKPALFNNNNQFNDVTNDQQELYVNEGELYVNNDPADADDDEEYLPMDGVQRQHQQPQQQHGKPSAKSGRGLPPRQVSQDVYTVADEPVASTQAPPCQEMYLDLINSPPAGDQAQEMYFDMGKSQPAAAPMQELYLNTDSTRRPNAAPRKTSSSRAGAMNAVVPPAPANETNSKKPDYYNQMAADEPVQDEYYNVPY